jgi:O-antigen/teichoic acid export membrane protein
VSAVTEALPRPAGGAVRLTLLGKGAEGCALALLVTLVPRALGPADYGLLAAVTATVGLLSAAASLSGPAVLSRFAAAVPAGERAGVARALAARALVPRAAVWVAAAAAGIAAAAIVPQRAAPAIVAVVLAALALDLGATLAQQAALALGRVGLYNARYPVQGAVLVLAAPPLHALLGARGAAAAAVLSSGAALAVCARPVLPQLLRARSAPVPAGAGRFALAQGASGLLLQAQHRAGPPLVVALAGSRVEAGLAAIAVGVPLALVYAVWALYAVELPRLVGAARRVAAAEVRRLSLGAVLGSGAAALLLVAAADRLLPALAGDRYRDALPALALALAVLPLSPLVAASGQLSALELRLRPRLAAAAAGALAWAVLAAVLVPSGGAVGVAAAFLAGGAVTAAAGWAAFARELGRPLLALSLAGAAAVLLLGAAL